MAWIPPGPVFCLLRYWGSTVMGSAGARYGPLAGAPGLEAT